MFFTLKFARIKKGIIGMKSLPIHMDDEIFTLIKSEKYKLIGPVIKDSEVSQKRLGTHRKICQV